ncbi:MAG: tetratricopeptide repeat protein [Bacteroidota bacterium]|nr:tetratricopeptide repeat protein [Bacteroidota bacterium]
MGKKASAKKKQKAEFKIIDLKKQKLWFIGIILAYAFVLYGNTIGNDYSFDDIYVTNNREVKQGMSIIPKLFISLYANMYEDGKPLTFGYRPVVKTSFALEYAAFGSNPHISHLINILLYALTSLLLFLILRKLFKGYHHLFPMVVTLLFMAHPSHTEIVSSLKNRDELLSFLGAIGTLHLFLVYIEKEKIIYGIIGLIVFLLAYLSKPTVTVFLPIYPVVLYFFTKPKTGQVVFFLLGVFVVIYLASFIPRMYLPQTHRPVQFIENPLYFEDSFWIKASTGLTIILFYLKMLIFPLHMRFYYGYDTIPVVGWDNFWVILSLLIHLALLAVAIWKFREKHILSFGILIYLIAIATFSNVLKQPMGIVADRFMYFPSLGFSIIIGYLIYKVFKQEPILQRIKEVNINKIIVLTIVILIPYSAKTITRNKDWKDQPTLLKKDIQYLENSAKANFIYAGTMKGVLMRAIRKSGKKDPRHKEAVDDILKHLNMAISTYPDYYQAYDMRGSIYITFFNKFDKAIEDFNRSLEIKEKYIPAYFGLGYCYLKKKDYQKAIYNYEKTIEYDPEHFQAHKSLLQIYQELGNIEKSNYYSRKTSELGAKLDKEIVKIKK